MKLLSLMILFSLGVCAQTAGTAVKSKKERWDKLMILVNQEMKILESAKKKGVDIKYRMLELHSEKLKLLHDKNNQEFMKASLSTKSGKNKESYFTETREYYLLTKNFGLNILKDEMKLSRKAEVKYAMALNSRDYGRDQITESYLLDVIDLSKNFKSTLRHHAQTALADFYYNEKKFPEAIRNYEKVIENREDDWLTKHLFNLSWCYLKNKNFNDAIETIKKAYFESKNTAFVDIRDQVLENIGSFYVYAGRPLEGMEFYLQNEKNPIPYLMSMSKKTSEKGHEKETKVILDTAQKLVEKNGFIEHQEDLYHSYLDFYRHYNRFSDHEKTSQLITEYYKKSSIELKKDPKSKFKSDFKDDAIEKLRTTAGFLQIKLSKDVKKDNSNYDVDELQMVLSYFSMLIQLDAGRSPEYLYFQAETYYSVQRFLDAAQGYVKAIEEAKKMNSQEYSRKSHDSLLALTGLEVMPKEKNKEFLTYVYSSHIKIWPRDEKSELIYPKLFEIYKEDNADEKATEVLSNYNKYYPEHLKPQQVLMTQVLDQFIDKKNTLKINFWIGEFKKGFLSFDRQTIEKTELVLGNLLFVEYQELAKKGKRLEAAKGFESLYAHKLYPNKVKYQAAFFASLIYLELADTTSSFKWLELAQTKMTEEEKLARREEQMTIAERYYRLQDFYHSFKLSSSLLQKFCSLKDDIQNRLFEISVVTSLVNLKPLESESIVSSYSKCLKNEALVQESLNKIYLHYEKYADFFGLRLFVRRQKVELMNTQFRLTLQKWYWEKNDVNLKHHILNELQAMNHPESNLWLKEIQKFQVAKKELDEFIQISFWDKPVFNEAQYNAALEQYLLKLKNYQDRYRDLTQSAQIDLSVMMTRMYAHIFEHVGFTIEKVKPMGMLPEMQDGFSQAMKSLSSQFHTSSKNYQQSLKKTLKDKEILTWGSRSLSLIENIENPVFSFYSGLTMDRAREK